MNSRKYPRTMQEAWGPYTSYELHPMTPEKHAPVWLIWGAIVIAVVVSIAVYEIF